MKSEEEEEKEGEKERKCADIYQFVSFSCSINVYAEEALFCCSINLKKIADI